MRKSVLLILCIIALLTVTVSAAVPPVVDNAGLLTDQQQSDLNVFFGQIRQDEGYSVNVVTTDDFKGKSAQDYAEDYYDDHIGGDGALLVVNLEEGYWYISTNGICAENISNARVDAIGEAVVDLIQDGAYNEAFYAFGDRIYEEMSSASSSVSQNSKSYGKSILVCLVIGFVIGGITTGIMAYNMRTVRSQRSAANYVCAGSLKISNSRDIYLYSTLHKTPKPKSNSSGGGHSRGGSGGRI